MQIKRWGTMGAKRKLEPLNKEESICSPRLCAIFGKHDEDPYEKPCTLKPKGQKYGSRSSLGDAVGMITADFLLKTDGRGFDTAQFRYATCLVAFGAFHIYPETVLNSTIFEEIMKRGLLLCAASQKDNYQLVSPPDVYGPQEQEVLRDFEFNEFKFYVELVNIPYKALIHIMKRSDGGDVRSTLLVKHIKSALGSVVREHIYYLLCVNEFYLMIWLNEGVYFIFDVCGRRTTDFNTDEDEGVPMFIGLKTLDNVNHLILNLSGLNEVDPCSIRELKVIKLVSPSGNIIQRSYGRSPLGYEIVNNDYAYIAAKLHLSLNPAALLRNRSALPAGVTALVVSKINHPATWNTGIVDNIICFAANFCQTYWHKCASSDPVDVDEFPNQFNIGQFRVHTEIFAKKYTGFWRCVPNYKSSELTEAIQKAFDDGDTKLLLEINYQMYAIWKQNEFIYLFDPFRHRVVGLYEQPYSIKHMGKFATVKMFRSFDVFAMVLNSVLLDWNVSSPFSLHAVKIRHIQVKNKADGTPAPYEESPMRSDGEVISLNELVCFEETDEMCQKLGEISDFEQESSEVEELELKSTSSEVEVMEEEEGNAEISLEGVEDGDDENMHPAESTMIHVSSSMRLIPGKENLPKRELPRLSEPAIEKPPEEDESLKDKHRKYGAKVDEMSENKDIKYGELPDQGLKDKRSKDKGLKEKGLKDKWLERKGLTDKELKDKELKDKELKDKELKDKELKDKELKDKKLKDAAERLEREKAAAAASRAACEKLFADSRRVCLAPNASHCPGLISKPVDMAVVRSETGGYNSLCKLICAGFRRADRILVVTPWKNFVLFRCVTNNIHHYFLYNGCTCNFNRFRYLNLEMGTAGLACFREIDDMIKFMRLERNRCVPKPLEVPDAYDICREYCR
uniref:Uncharacterized protein n=1 Tax=Glossina pallidipes TaxID=7398 RepID=A0A1B0AAA4_GLOPL